MERSSAISAVSNGKNAGASMRMKTIYFERAEGTHSRNEEEPTRLLRDFGEEHQKCILHCPQRFINAWGIAAVIRTHRFESICQRVIRFFFIAPE